MTSRQLQCNQSRTLKLAIEKRCRLHKLVRQRFAFALGIQQMLFAMRKISSGSSRELQCYCISSRHGIPDARKEEVAKRCNQAQSIQSTKNSAETQSSSRHESAAKQLMIYESWMSTAELNSNGENDKEACKRKDTRTIPCPFCLRARDSTDALCDEENQQVQLSRVTSSSLCIQSQDDVPVASYSGSSRELQCYCISSRHGIPDARKEEVAKRCNQAQSIQSTKNSAEAQSSSRHESAAKQLMIYESWMSTAELNSNGENDKEACKRKDTRTIPCLASLIQLQAYRFYQLDNQTQATADPVASYSGSSHELQCFAYPVDMDFQTQRKNSAEAQSSSRHESAAKQLMIYESWMSTAELNSNGENDKEACKRKDTRTIPCRYFTRHI
ncbi:hypothetical protein F511_41124 [Dorcoceras hygrometricum]|uniref:Uncharacterized protein n=1 Tax=Dorcoceras hygrometricum TaxID=472368 RepID=A0A2Z7B787_9LAMI|nr:hypothetical protein F511_41124 [Dorcoceras hygrometricum]